MKRIVFVVFAMMLAVAACQKKEEPKAQYQPPAVSLQSAEEVRLLQDMVKNDPGNVNAWIKLGNTLMDASRFDEAVEAYQKALDIDPKNVDVRVDMGTCYKNARKPDKAVEEYRKALQINPRHLNGQRNLAVVLAFDLRDRAAAVKEFEKYLELAPNAQDAAQVRQLIADLKAGK